jgi:hypothetical protein
MKQKIRDRKKKLEQLEGQVSVERYEGVIRHNKRLDFTDDMNELATVQSHQDAAAQGEKMASTDDLNEHSGAELSGRGKSRRATGAD